MKQYRLQRNQYEQSVVQPLERKLNHLTKELLEKRHGGQEFLRRKVEIGNQLGKCYSHLKKMEAESYAEKELSWDSIMAN